MTRFVTDRMPTPASFAIALLLTFVVNAHLNAGCGDYVQVGNHSGRKAAGLATHHPMPSAPCHGPNCSRRQVPLIPAPVPPTSQPSNDWFCLPLGSHAQRDERIGQIDDCEFNSLTGMSLDIFHPPR